MLDPRFTMCAVFIAASSGNNLALAQDDPTASVAAAPFISPARMASSAFDSPNAVTTLDSETLRKLGIVDMVDAMRLVPGMLVSETHGSDESIGYHGANVNVPRRTEVLYNSSHLYRPGYASAHWSRLPVDIQDLNFIEVTRGPTLEYGNNGMTSTVNFIQDSPATRGADISVRAGDGGVREVYLTSGLNVGVTQLGARYFHRENGGFDGAVNFVGDYNNDLTSDSVLFNAEHYLNPSVLLDVSAGYISSTYVVPGFNNITNANDATQRATDNFIGTPDTDENSGFFAAKIHSLFNTGSFTHDVVLGISYNAFEREQKLGLCPNRLVLDPLVGEVAALPSVAFSLDDELAFGIAAFTGNLDLEHSLIATPSASEQAVIDRLGRHIQSVGLSIFDPQCGTTDQDFEEDRWELSSRASTALTPELKNNFGFSVSHLDVQSDTYFGGNVSLDTYRIYDNLQYSPGTRWVFNAGFSVDTVDSYQTDAAFSYRLAANYRFSNSLVLRVMTSQAERTPDLHETERDWTYTVVYSGDKIDHLGRSAGTIAQRSKSPNSLRPENLQSTELGLIYQRGANLIFDAKLFYEDYSDLISEPFLFADFNLSNEGELENNGVEFLVKHAPNGNFTWGASYAYLDSKSNNPYEDTLRTKHSGSLWGIASLGNGLDLSAAYYGASKVAKGSYDRFNATLSHETRLKAGSLSFQINYRHYPDGINAFTEISPYEPNVGLIGGRDRVLATVRFTAF